MLAPAGELETATNRSAAGTDRYILRGGGPDIWEPRFTFHGCRYAEISGPEGSTATVALPSWDRDKRVGPGEHTFRAA